jgi:hypothetical protein
MCSCRRLARRRGRRGARLRRATWGARLRRATWGARLRRATWGARLRRAMGGVRLRRAMGGVRLRRAMGGVRLRRATGGVRLRRAMGGVRLRGATPLSGRTSERPSRVAGPASPGPLSSVPPECTPVPALEIRSQRVVPLEGGDNRERLACGSGGKHYERLIRRGGLRTKAAARRADEQGEETQACAPRASPSKPSAHSRLALHGADPARSWRLVVRSPYFAAQRPKSSQLRIGCLHSGHGMGWPVVRWTGMARRSRFMKSGSSDAM